LTFFKYLVYCTARTATVDSIRAREGLVPVNTYALLKLVHVVAVIRLGEAVAAGDDARLAAARRQVGRLNVIYLVLLFSVVGAMVLKPTL
jgi:hypothetical protein